MICSVLIPSRKRPEGLTKAVYTLMQTASDQNNIEVLIKFDDDDKTAKQWTTPYPNVKTFFGPRGAGYRELHVFYQFLANQAQGHYLWIFNDDAWVKMAQNGDNFPVRAHEGEQPKLFDYQPLPWDVQLQAIKDSNPATQHIVQPHEPKYGLVECGCFPLFTQACWREWPFGMENPIDPHSDMRVKQKGGRTYYMPGVLVIHDRGTAEEQWLHQNT